MTSQPFSYIKKFVFGEAQFKFWDIVARVIAIVNTFIIVKTLGDAYQYGVFQLFLSAGSFASLIFILDSAVIGPEILRAIGDGDEPRAKRLFLESSLIRFTLAVIAWVVIFFGAPYILQKWYKPDFIAMVRVFSLYPLTEALTTVTKLLLKVRLDFGRLASRRALNKAVQLVVLVGFILFSHTITVREILLSIFIAAVVPVFTFVPALMRAWLPWRTVSAENRVLITGVIRAHGKWAMARTFFSQAVSNIEPWLIKFFIGTEGVGLYSFAVQLVDVFKTLLKLNTIPTLIARGLADKQRIRRILLFGMKYLFLGSVVLASIGALAVTVAIPRIFPELAGALPYAYLLFLFMPLNSPFTIHPAILDAMRLQKYKFTQAIIRQTLSFLLTLIVLPTIGLKGLPIIRFLQTTGAGLASHWYLARRESTLAFSYKAFFRFGPEDRMFLRDIGKSTGEFLSVLRRTLRI